MVIGYISLTQDAGTAKEKVFQKKFVKFLRTKHSEILDKKIKMVYIIRIQ